MGAWVAAIGVVAGVAALGGSSTAEPDASAAVASPVVTSPVPIALAAASPSPEARRIVLFEPGEGIVTSQELMVRGSVDAGVDHVAVILESSGYKPLSMTTVEAASPFTLTLPIPVQRDGTTIRMRVIAYDAGGIPIDVVGRQIVIGPYVPRSIGGDGFVGGIVFGASWEERRGDP